MLDNVYKSFPRFIQHLQMQNANIVQFQTEIGATATDLAEVPQDAVAGEFLGEITELCNEFKETAFGIKGSFFSTKTTPPAGDFMTAPDTRPPATIVAGAVKRSRDRDQRFLNSPTLTEAAKIAMDLYGEEPPNVTPDTVKPTVETRSAVSGYEFAVVVGNRQKSDMYDIQIQRKGTGVWETVKSGTGKSINVVITPSSAGDAEQVLVRVVLRKSNQQYGIPSDPVYVTVNP